MALDVLEELESTVELPAVDGLGSLAGVLERDTEVGAAGAGRLGGQNLGRSVTDLNTKKNQSVSFRHNTLFDKFSSCSWSHRGGVEHRATSLVQFEIDISLAGGMTATRNNFDNLGIDSLHFEKDNSAVDVLAEDSGTRAYSTHHLDDFGVGDDLVRLPWVRCARS